MWQDLRVLVQGNLRTACQPSTLLARSYGGHPSTGGWLANRSSRMQPWFEVVGAFKDAA